MTGSNPFQKFALQENREQGKKSSRAGRKKAPHFEVVAQKEGYKEFQKGKKVVAQKDGYKVVTSVVLRRNGGVFSIKFLHIVLSCQLRDEF